MRLVRGLVHSSSCGATLLQLGRVREAYKAAQELERLATRFGHIPALSLSRRRLAWVEFWKAPNLDQLENEVRREFDAHIGGAEPFLVSVLSPEQLSTVKFLRGSWDDALRCAETARSSEPPRYVQSMNVAMRFRAMAYSGDGAGALKLLEDRREMVARFEKTNTYGSWALLMSAIEGLYVLGEGEKAAALYPWARGLIDTGTICILNMSRFTQTKAGVAAGAAHNWEGAEEHFQIAMQQAESFPNVLEQADIRRFHAMVLIDRAAPEDRERVRALLNDALRTYQRIKMPGHVGLTQSLLDKTC